MSVGFRSLLAPWVGGASTSSAPPAATVGFMSPFPWAMGRMGTGGAGPVATRRRVTDFIVQNLYGDYGRFDI